MLQKPLGTTDRERGGGERWRKRKEVVSGGGKRGVRGIDGVREMEKGRDSGEKERERGQKGSQRGTQRETKRRKKRGFVISKEEATTTERERDVA